ncbi:MAG TPA: GNAT family N-acetyltransferase [Thermoplasmata archaeon]|nr:GNAT family N-acetyltransferase [Thermoplasmata archaeon]
MELEDRCSRSLVEGLNESGRFLGEVHRKEWPTALAVKGPLPSELSNVLLVESPPESWESLLFEAHEFFRPGTPWRMMVRRPAVDLVRSVADQSHLRYAGEAPGMLMHPIPRAPPSPPSLRVEAVLDDRRRIDWLRAIARSFGIPMFVLRHLFPVVPSLEDEPPIGGFVGYDTTGTPVASSAFVVLRGVVNVYMVGTVPKARRKGFGAALTWAALARGRSAGADVGALNATEMGRPVYDRMGFRVFEPYPQWEPVLSRTARWRARASILALAFRRPHVYVGSPPGRGGTAPEPSNTLR